MLDQPLASPTRYFSPRVVSPSRTDPPCALSCCCWQRRVDLSVNDCSTGAVGKEYFDYEPSECREVQAATRREEERCPVRE